MSEKLFAGQMKAMIENIKANGTAAIYCDNLINYLQQVEDSPQHEPSIKELEGYKAELQHRIEINKLNHESQLEMFRSVIASGQSAIKSSFLLNGGSAVALLAFIGHLAEFKPTMVPVFANCLMPFCYGVLAVSLTAGATYLTQWFYASPKPFAKKAGFTLNIFCILLGFFAYGLFLWGLFSSYSAFVAYS